MSIASMVRHFGRTSLAITGFAALVLATGFSALSPRPETALAGTAQDAATHSSLSARLMDRSRRVQVAELQQATPIVLQAIFAEEAQADMTPSLLATTPDEPAAVEETQAPAKDVSVRETSALIRAALKDAARPTDRQSQCLAEAVYFEARGESLDGQLAVAQVILNRVADKRFAKSICGVVQERSPGPSRACQFSFVCDTRSDVPTPSQAWNVAQAVAMVALNEATPDISDRALFFHATRVNPKWRHRMQYTRTVGTHAFYR
jgi:spore germination cell wall hydrolase CwlJ-like protein